MGSCGALSSGDAAERYPVEMLQALSGGDAASAAWWRYCGALPGGDAAERCPVEMLRSAAWWRCCEALLALLDEGTVA